MMLCDVASISYLSHLILRRTLLIRRGQSTATSLDSRNSNPKPFALSQVRWCKQSTKKVLLEFRGGSAMKNQNILKTTSQKSFSPEHLAALSLVTSLSNSCCKFSQQGPSLELFLCHTDRAFVASLLFSIALKHPVHLYNCNDAKVARFLYWTKAPGIIRFLREDMEGKERFKGFRADLTISKPGIYIRISITLVFHSFNKYHKFPTSRAKC